MSIPAPVAAARKVVTTARKWARSRMALRQKMDSKSTKDTVIETARKRHIADALALEKAIAEMEGAFKQYSLKTPKGQKKPFPWREVLSVVGHGASALDKMLSHPGPGPVVIDAVGESIPRK